MKLGNAEGSINPMQVSESHPEETLQQLADVLSLQWSPSEHILPANLHALCLELIDLGFTTALLSNPRSSI